jgi:transcriptional regulator with XRE-family HTH domain
MMKKPKGYISPLERSKDPEIRRRINEQVQKILLSDLMIEEMKKHRLSVRKLAKYANVSATTIQSIRDGEAKNIGMGKLEHILNFVGRTIDFPPIKAGHGRSLSVAPENAPKSRA